MTRKYGVSSTGLIAPIIREGDDLSKIVVDTVLNAIDNIEDGDIIGITESIVARAEGNYVTIDELVKEIKMVLYNPKRVYLYAPIYSRNRFAMILKAFARAVENELQIYMPEYDEVGNVLRNHPFTGLNYDEYYKSIVEAEGKRCIINYEAPTLIDLTLEGWKELELVNCELHSKSSYSDIPTLKSFCKDKCNYGLLGSNKASEERLKLFPSYDYSHTLVDEISNEIFEKTGKNVECFVFGDGCYKDPESGIFEFADPVTCPAYTEGLEGTPNELKLKNLADEKYVNFSGAALEEAIKEDIRQKDKNLKGKMASQGTTPRKYTNLLASLADLTVASGDKGCPIVYIKNYFKNYADD